MISGWELGLCNINRSSVLSILLASQPGYQISARNTTLHSYALLAINNKSSKTSKNDKYYLHFALVKQSLIHNQ